MRLITIKTALFQLHYAQKLGRSTLWKLIREYGSAENVLQAGCKNNVLFDRWTIASSWERELEEIEKKNIQLIAYDEESYPKNLLQIPDFPLLLYVKGNLNFKSVRVALIGTRTATLYGKQAADKIAQDLAHAGVCIVSGLARGIDTAAHQGALAAGGTTIAVLGSGLSRIYPQENFELAEKIVSSGALISEYSLYTPPSPPLFPRRNRLISGLSEAICLVESPLKGGGMLTMEIGKSHHRPLFAVPGRIDWPTFEGNHHLLLMRKARLATKGEDLLKYLNIINNQTVKTKPLINLTQEEVFFLEKLPQEEKSIEELVLLTQLPVMQLNVLLTRLILKKAVKEFPGKIYKKIA